MNGRTHVVGIGGGSGLSVLLAGLKQCSRNHGPVDISAIVSVADDGGSTGKLRRHLGIPAVGDLRNCMVALSHGDPLWGDLFQHRFNGGEGLDGHALGNLIFAALLQRAGGLKPAVDELARLLRLAGRVLPVTEEPVILGADLEDGDSIVGESRLAGTGRKIARVWLQPASPAPAEGVLEAIDAADAIVFGPGSLYTSVIPNLLVDGVAEAIRDAPALKIFVCNLMTEPGETDGFDVAEHLRVLQDYLQGGTVDVCLVNVSAPAPELADRYAATGSAPVGWSRGRLAANGVLPIVADLRARGQLLDRHDPARLGEIVLSLARSLRRQPEPAVPANTLVTAPALQAASRGL